MDQNKEYFAFISYQRKDEEWADRLRNKLEHYRLPSSVRKQDASLPKEIRPIFRDALELSGGVLAKEIEKALQQSKYLIVICSPNSARSPWVNKETQTFIDLGRERKIIPFIIDGTPFSDNEETECFPPALRSLRGERELLGISHNEIDSNGDAASIKVVARMFGLKFDTLWQRYEREKRKKKNWIIAAVTTAIFLLSGIAFGMYWQNQQTQKANLKMLENLSRFVSEKALNLAMEDDPYVAQLLALRVLPKDLCHPNLPYTIEAENALRMAECKSILDESTSVNPLGNKIISIKGTLWNLDNGKIINEIEGAKAVLSPDGKKIIYTIPDDSVCVWDLETSRCTKSFYCPKSAFSVAISPDGSKIAVASRNVSLIDFKTGSIIWTIDGLKHSLFKELGTTIDNIFFTKDGKYLACVHHLLKIFSVDDGECVNTFKDNNDFFSASISPNSMRVVFPAGNKVKICDTFSGKCLFYTDSILSSYTGLFGNGYYVDLDFSPDGNFFVLASGPELSIWDANKGECIEKRRNVDRYFKQAVFSPNGQKILYTQEDTCLKMWNFTSEQLLPLKITSFLEQPIMSGFDFQGNKILTVCKNKILIWDAGMRTSKIISNIHTKNVGYASFSPDGKSIVSVSFNNQIKIIDIASGGCLHTINVGELLDSFTSDPYVAYNPMGNQILFVSPGRVAKIWDSKKWKCIKTIPNVNVASFSKDGKHFVTLVDHRRIKVWDSKTYNCISTSEKEDDFTCITISQDGKKIVTATDDCIFDIWDLYTGKHLNRIVAEKSDESFLDKILALSLSPDGNQIIAISSWPIGVWDVKSGNCISTLGGKYAPGNRYAAFSPDGRKAIAVGDGEFIRLWRYPNLQQLINVARERFKDRNLTAEELKKYYLE